MTTAARDWNLSSFKTVRSSYYNRWTGERSQGEHTFSRRYQESVRPQSINNAKRADNTRPNGPWDHRWAHTDQRVGFISGQAGAAYDVTSRGPILYHGASGAPDSSLVDGLMRNARLKALSKATEKTAQLNAALAQSRDVVRMATKYTQLAARGLDKLWDSWPKDMLNFAKGEVKAIPDHYLAYLYGMAPLGDDIANGLDQLSQFRDSGMGMSMILRGAEKLRDTVTIGNGVWFGLGTVAIQFPARRTTACRVGYRFDIPSWYLERAPTVAPFSTAYQLARYSFVVDWILPVGNWIGALESAQFSPFFKEGWEVWYVQEDGDLTASEIVHAEHPASMQLSLEGKWQRGRTVRTVISTYPSSILTRPALKPFPGINQFSQGLSLLTQALQRRR